MPNSLKETIILSRNIDGNNYLKSIALFGESSFGIRILNGVKLATLALDRNGFTNKDEFCPRNLIAAKLYSKIKEIDYFKSFKYLDVYNLIGSINNLRYFIPNNESDSIHEGLVSNKFVRKNKAVIRAYDLLMELFQEEHIIDEIRLIRLAIEQCKPIKNIDFKVFKTNKLRPLELELLKVLSDGHIEEIEFEDNIKVKTYTKAFGQTNEIENILEYIYKNKIPFDQCLIATSNIKDYGKILSNYRDILNIPLTIGGSINIVDTNPGKFYNSIKDYIWSNSHKDYLSGLINASFFNKPQLIKDLEIPDTFDELNDGLDYFNKIDVNKIFSIIGDFRFGFEQNEENDEKFEDAKTLIEYNNSARRLEFEYVMYSRLLPFIKKFKDIVNEGIINFLSRYIIINQEQANLENDALDKILSLLTYFHDYKIPLEELNEAINQISVGGLRPSEGQLHLTTIDGALSSLRSNLFVVGLNSNNFPGKAIEDPIIMDDDYLRFGVKDASNLRVNQNKQTFFELLKLANKYKVDVHLSYSYYNSETLKNQSASSVIFEAFKKEENKEVTINNFSNLFKENNQRFNTVSYFDSNLVFTNSIGRILNANKTIEKESKDEEESRFAEISKLKNKQFSASNVKDFAECQYLFYLKYVVGVEQPEETKIYEVINHRDYGTLAHSLLENLDKNLTNLETFKETSAKVFDEYMILHPTTNTSVAERTKEEFVKMMANAYDMEENERAIFKETNIWCKHNESGLFIHGFPDKVVGLSDGTFKVIDYKTGSRVSHKMDDIPSIIQGAMYSYILEHRKDVEVSGFEYRYIKLNSRVRSDETGLTMQNHYETLSTVLKDLRNSLTTGNFEANGDCKNCFFKDICNRRKN